MSANIGQWKVIAEVQGSAKKPYRIAYNEKQFGCGCPAWTKGAHARENCKHIKKVLGILNGGSDSTVTLLPEGQRLKTAMDLAMAAL